MILRTCSGGMSTLPDSAYPNLRLLPYRFEFSCCHFRAVTRHARQHGVRHAGSAATGDARSRAGCSAGGGGGGERTLLLQLRVRLLRHLRWLRNTHTHTCEVSFRQRRSARPAARPGASSNPRPQLFVLPSARSAPPIRRRSSPRRRDRRVSAKPPALRALRHQKQETGSRRKRTSIATPPPACGGRRSPAADGRAGSPPLSSSLQSPPKAAQTGLSAEALSDLFNPSF